MSTNTGRVRKFAVSIDPDEVVDFEEPLSYFEETLTNIGLDQVSTYRFRFKDEECTITADLEQSTDGYEVWLTVQATDLHEYRVQDIVEAFDAYLVSSYSGARTAVR
jgi:hypothetical protein